MSMCNGSEGMMSENVQGCECGYVKIRVVW